jgi:hypothetical protein
MERVSTIAQEKDECEYTNMQCGTIVVAAAIVVTVAIAFAAVVVTVAITFAVASATVQLP